MSINQNMLYSSFLYLFVLNHSLFFSLNDNQSILLNSLVVVLMLVIYLKTDKKKTLNKKNVSTQKKVIMVVIGLLCSFIIQWLVITLTNYMAPNLILTNQLTHNTSIQFILVTILFNPIMEELVFRFSFVNWVGQKLPIWLGMIISSVLFMLMHTTGNLLIYFFLGLIFSYLYKKSGTIIVSIVVHMLLNILVLYLN